MPPLELGGQVGLGPRPEGRVLHLHQLLGAGERGAHVPVDGRAVDPPALFLLVVEYVDGALVAHPQPLYRVVDPRHGQSVLHLPRPDEVLGRHAQLLELGPEGGLVVLGRLDPLELERDLEVA